MTFYFSKDNSNLRLFLLGDIDLETTPVIKSQLADEIEECSSLDIDGSKVSYIDSSGISILVIAMQSCAKHDVTFTISKLSEQLMRVVELAHLDKLLPIGEIYGKADAEDITDFENTEFTDGDILHDIATRGDEDAQSEGFAVDDEALATELDKQTSATSIQSAQSTSQPSPQPTSRPTLRPTLRPTPNKSDSNLNHERDPERDPERNPESDPESGSDIQSRSKDTPFKPGTF